MPHALRRLATVLALALLVGCGDPTVAEMVQKTEKVGTKAELETLLGKPHEISKVGPVETWTYNTFGAMPSVSYAGELQIGFRRVEATEYFVMGGVGPGVWPPYVREAMETVNRAAVQDPTLEFEPWGGPSRRAM